MRPVTLPAAYLSHSLFKDGPVRVNLLFENGGRVPRALAYPDGRVRGDTDRSGNAALQVRTGNGRARSGQGRSGQERSGKGREGQEM